jgi:HNH endonuclease/AP2 domain
MKQIPLTQEKVALVDDSDFGFLNQWKWYAQQQTYNSWYAQRTVNMKKGTRVILMHRWILNATDAMQVDHINNNKLDNRRGNLRLCSHAENIHNQKTRSTNTSGFKGVSWHKGKQKWCAKICANMKQKHLGAFDTKVDAAKAYNEAALREYGQFARLNVIPI